MTGIPYAQCYPSAGTDHMDPTTATLELEIIGIGNATLTAKGPTDVTRGYPYDPGDGRIKIDTEIISMNLQGTSSLMGLITIVESPTKPSSGFIQQILAGCEFDIAHTSYFDVFVEIQTTLPPPLSTLHNDDPIPMNTTIYAIPPWGSVYTSPPEPIPLKDEQDNIIGFIKHVSHKIGTGPIPIGGICIPIYKPAFSTSYIIELVPYIALASTIILAVSISVAYIKYRKKQ